MNKFSTELWKEINISEKNDHSGNWDVMSRGPEPEAPLERYFLRDLIGKFYPTRKYRTKLRQYESIGYLYDLLNDLCSKELLVKLFAFRAMGHRKIKLPQSNPEHWDNIKRIEQLEIVGPALPIGYMDITLQQRGLKPIGFDIRAYCTGAGASYTFLQRQYELHRDAVRCKAEKGDFVIDAGACWGETSLYFAHEVGKEGRVFSFEFIPSNMEVLRKNIAANPQLADTINVIDKPLWNQDGQIVYYVDWGPGSRVSFEKLREDFANTQCATTTIDHIVSEYNVPRVDFIKMDIEGAELNALKGAEDTILRYRPKLAISLYHSIDDFKTIPRYLNSLGLSYKYYLDHHTIYENETVLFAVPQHE
ncbi:MAG: FkbM family methyltransferase [Nitrosospira sp.]